MFLGWRLGINPRPCVETRSGSMTAPQSRDRARRYEDVTAFLRKQDGRWVIQLLGPCGEAQDPQSDCDEDTDPERLMERFPTLPPDLVPEERDDPARPDRSRTR